MQAELSFIVAANLLEKCGQGKDTAFYALLPLPSLEESYAKRAYHHALENKAALLESAREILGGVKTSVARSSLVYLSLQREKEKIWQIMASLKEELRLPSTIGTEKVPAALSLITNSYVKSLFHPVQFFLPHAAACSGQWTCWEKNNYLELLQKMEEKDFQKRLKKKLQEPTFWDVPCKPEQFSEIVRRRLQKEQAFEKALSPEALIKAMIIRLGETAKPEINYEIIDYTIRSFFTYLDVKQYVRVDREIRYLREIENRITRLLTEESGSHCI